MEKKILVVDDIKKNIQLLGSVLGKEGYAVSYATNGAKALAMADVDNFDLILLDVMMPDMNGFEVCRHLKQKESTKDIPILFLTAKSEEGDVVEGLQLGAADYLTKPFNSAELVARVKTQMRLREAQHLLLQRNKDLWQKTLQLGELLEENRKAMSEIKILRGFLPICSKCKKIRDDDGYWTQIESYIREHSEAQFTHSICQDCADELYPFFTKKK